MSWLNYHHLYYFYVITDEGSIASASRKLRLAQSTLSAQLSQFEDVCGCKLFERRNRALHLTENGKTLFEYADDIFSIGREAQDFLRDQKKRKTLKIQVGVVESVPKRISEQMVHLTVKKHNGSITVVEGQITTLLSKLKQHRLDFVLTTKRVSEGKSQKLNYRLAMDIPIYIVGTKEWKNLRRGYPKSLHKQPFIFPGTFSNMRTEINEFFDSVDIKPKKTIEANDIELQRRLVISGLAISGLPHLAIVDELKKGELQLISKEPIGYERLWFVTVNRKVQNPLAKMVMDDLLEWKKGL